MNRNEFVKTTAVIGRKKVFAFEQFIELGTKQVNFLISHERTMDVLSTGFCFK
jgi:hypothetical protein